MKFAKHNCGTCGAFPYDKKKPKKKKDESGNAMFDKNE